MKSKIGLKFFGLFPVLGLTSNRIANSKILHEQSHASNTMLFVITHIKIIKIIDFIFSFCLVNFLNI